eukprot:TRINITY_DN16334_c0_g3_i1.p1 TRINITY_DN16334_c0_g3~~TRINITY_DN16334_c0_g3_i1.p1  ORF type:complete len:310 (+),score=99.18 TRINITY_DN16334_c0_g3_i1:46-930(+)
MKRTVPVLLKGTAPARGGAGLDNPYFPYARSGTPSTAGSKWQTEGDIRHEADGKWGPTRYGGDEYPTMTQFLSNMNDAHPVIEPLYHPKLTHQQKICRLYRRSLKTVVELCCTKFKEDNGLLGFYARQVRDEFEKNRNADAGSAEWLFVRAVNYIEQKKGLVGFGMDYDVGRTSHNRYAHYNHPDEYDTFPHGFDPEEAYKLMNPYHKFGVPFLGKNLAYVNPSVFMMRPWTKFRPGPGDKFMYAGWFFFVTCGLVAMSAWAGTTALGVPQFSKEQQTAGGCSENRTVPHARAL